MMGRCADSSGFSEDLGGPWEAHLNVAHSSSSTTDLNIHEIVDVDASELGELLPTLFQKGRNIVTLLTLYTKSLGANELAWSK